jgi:hypothetical protein
MLTCPEIEKKDSFQDETTGQIWLPNPLSGGIFSPPKCVFQDGGVFFFEKPNKTTWTDLPSWYGLGRVSY